MEFRFLLGVLCVWRLTHLLAVEDGPLGVFRRLRDAVGGGFWGALTGCFYCLSLWVAAPVAWAVADSWPLRGLAWMALSAGAILLERATVRVQWQEANE